MKKTLIRTAVAAATLLSLGLAQAKIIDFEQAVASPFAPFAPLFGHNDEFYQQDFFFAPFSNDAGAQNGDLVGAMVNGADLASTCFGVVCPTNNATNFYTSLNDGVLAFGTTSGNLFRVNGFDASFLGASGLALPGVPGLLRLQGITATGASLTQTYQLPGASATGQLGFGSFLTTGAFANTDFALVYAFGFACNAAGSCSAFTTDQAQFGLDNLDVRVIPEPASWALVGLALAGMGALRRRRAA